MNEQTRPTHEQSPGGGGISGLFDEVEEQDRRLVTVASGPYAEHLPVSNLSVGEIRARFSDRFDIDPRSVAVLDGHDVNDNTVVRAGQVLMFMHRAGEKGGDRRMILNKFQRVAEPPGTPVSVIRVGNEPSNS